MEHFLNHGSSYHLSMRNGNIRAIDMISDTESQFEDREYPVIKAIEVFFFKKLLGCPHFFFLGGACF